MGPRDGVVRQPVDAGRERKKRRNAANHPDDQYEEIKVKKRRPKTSKQQLRAEDSDEECAREPLGEQFIQQKLNQRLERSTMGKKSRNAKKQAARSKKAPEKRKLRSSTEKQRNEKDDSDEIVLKNVKPAARKEDEDEEFQEDEYEQENKPSGGEDDDSDEEEEEPRGKKRGRHDEDEDSDGEDEASDDEDEETPRKKSKSSSKRGGSATKRSGKSTKRSEDSTVVRLREQLLLAETMPKKKKSASDTKDLEIGERQALFTAKVHLYQFCKVLTGPKMLRKACNFVMKRVDPKELRGLKGEEKDKGEERWIFKHDNLIRTGINRQRNYSIGELRELYAGTDGIFAEGLEDKWPNPEEIYLIIMRQGLEDGGPVKKTKFAKKDLEKKFVKYWDKLLVKTAGIKYWSDTKKCYGNISTYGDLPNSGSTLNEGPYICPNAEAMVCWIFEGYYWQWEWSVNEAKYKEKLEKQTITQEEFDKLEKRGKDNPFNSSKAGSKRWGGITEKGMERLKELTELVAQNRKDNAEMIKRVEDKALLEVKRIHKREDDPKNTKKTPIRKVTSLVSEADLDEDDMESGWCG